MMPPRVLCCSASAGPFCKQMFTVSFFVPFAVQVGYSTVWCQHCTAQLRDNNLDTLLPPLPPAVASRRLEYPSPIIQVRRQHDSLPCACHPLHAGCSSSCPLPHADIYIDKSPAFKAYVGQAGGFMLDDYSIARFARKLLDVSAVPWWAGRTAGRWLGDSWLAPLSSQTQPFLTPPFIPPTKQALDAEGASYEEESFFFAGEP